MILAGIVRLVCVVGHSTYLKIEGPPLMTRTFEGRDVTYVARPCVQCGNPLGYVTHGNTRLHRACLRAAWRDRRRAIAKAVTRALAP